MSVVGWTVFAMGMVDVISELVRYIHLSWCTVTHKVTQKTNTHDVVVVQTFHYSYSSPAIIRHKNETEMLTEKDKHSDFSKGVLGPLFLFFVSGPVMYVLMGLHILISNETSRHILHSIVSLPIYTGLTADACFLWYGWFCMHGCFVNNTDTQNHHADMNGY